MQNFRFVPETIAIEVGDSIKWVNRGSARHDARRELTPMFATNLLAPGEESNPITFSQASDMAGFEYFCAPHASFMRGHIVVVLPGSDMSAFSAEHARAGHHELAETVVEVIAKSGGPGHRWEDQNGAASPQEATIGRPENRLMIRVNNGDIVRFRVASVPQHAVIFERAKEETRAGVWQVVPGSGELGDLPVDFRNFDRTIAQKTPKKGNGGVLIEIKIINLTHGSSILFACDPHSTGTDPTKQPMLGAIVPVS
ncbi:MAG: plastocyanin/azurin family copper-binding protein [Planctomycetales bacterium]